MRVIGLKHVASWRTVAAAVAAQVIVPAMGSAPAAAQSMTPMRGEVKSFNDRFAVRVFPGNPYKHRIRVEVRVYDEAFNEVAADVVPRETMIGAEDRRSVLVMVPFVAAKDRKIRVCTESVPFNSQLARMKTQVCGRFYAQRVQ